MLTGKVLINNDLCHVLAGRAKGHSFRINELANAARVVASKVLMSKNLTS